MGILVAFYRLINSSVKNPRSDYSYSRFNLLPGISPSNLIQLRNYSSEREIVLSLSFISGFSDVEGSLVVTILNNPKHRTGWNVQARFQIKLHKKDRALLFSSKNRFDNIGYISKINDRFAVE